VNRIERLVGLSCLTCLLLFNSYFSDSRLTEYDLRASYTKSEYRVPMRDGVHVFNTVYAPNDNSRKYPFMLFRTPYGTHPYGPENYRKLLGPSADFAKEGFIFVYQDVRGKFNSEGDFVVMRPILPVKRNKTDIDESSDVYDTID